VTSANAPGSGSSSFRGAGVHAAAQRGHSQETVVGRIICAPGSPAQAMAHPRRCLRSPRQLNDGAARAADCLIVRPPHASALPAARQCQSCRFRQGYCRSKSTLTCGRCALSALGYGPGPIRGISCRCRRCLAKTRLATTPR